MMKTLYLLRHAHATNAGPHSAEDFERILTPAGEDAARQVGEFMKSENMLPEFVIGSPALRTMQTSRTIFGCILGNEGQKVASNFDRSIYLAPADLLLGHIFATNDDIHHLLVVAHNPGIADLARDLAGQALSDYTTDYAPATLSVFKTSVKSWSELSPITTELKKVFCP